MDLNEKGVEFTMWDRLNVKESKNGDFCRYMGCSNNLRRENGDKRFCKRGCQYTAYDFHNWLLEKGYKIVKETY